VAGEDEGDCGSAAATGGECFGDPPPNSLPRAHRTSGLSPEPRSQTECTRSLLEFDLSLREDPAEEPLKALISSCRKVLGEVRVTVLYADGDIYRVAEPDDASDSSADPGQGYPRVSKEPQLHESAILAPLFRQQEVIGAIHVSGGSNGVWGDGELYLLELLARLASPIVGNAIALKKLNAELSNKRFGELIGECPSMVNVFRSAQKVAATDVNVMITGETGTGKELIAREIHRRSARAKGPLMAVNCAAIPENLLEAELFGHERGAFTGATASRPGKFQLANHGTLFLDEVGECSPELQAKLLRAIDKREVYRVGASKPDECDIRIVAATNRKLEFMLKTGEFREDLYYRLNVVDLHLPPLRERGGDTVLIAKALLSKHADVNAPAPTFSPAALEAIRTYDWPGNIRDLENRIKKALVLCENALLEPWDLGLGSERQRQDSPPTANDDGLTLEEFSRKHPDLARDFPESTLKEALGRGDVVRVLEELFRGYREAESSRRKTVEDASEVLGTAGTSAPDESQKKSVTSGALRQAAQRVRERTAAALAEETNRPIDKADLDRAIEQAIDGVTGGAAEILRKEAAGFKQAAAVRIDEINALVAGPASDVVDLLERLLRPFIRPPRKT
jgi:transcriptional regulator with GAF, ATPase, and Fis domain